MASWQATMLNIALRNTLKPIFRLAPDVLSLRSMFEALQSVSFRLPEGTDIEAAEPYSFDGQWVTVPESTTNRVILYLPGGALLVPATQWHRAMLARICVETRARGLMVNYRLAPEHPFPAGLEDCLAAYRYLIDEVCEPRNIVIAGDSAGGGLTLATLVALRDDGDPMPGGAVVMSPLADLTFKGKSRERNRWIDPMLPARRSLHQPDLYLHDTPAEHPLVSPVYADFHGLPPVLGQVGSTEMLLDDVVRAAKKAREQLVDFEVEVWDKAPHVFQIFDFLPESRKAIARIGEFVRIHTAA